MRACEHRSSLCTADRGSLLVVLEIQDPAPQMWANICLGRHENTDVSRDIAKGAVEAGTVSERGE